MSEFGPKEDEYDPEIDWLDPCCQRELRDRKKYASISEKLRKTDRSNVRWDSIQTALQDLREGAWKKCHCCTATSDYQALKQLRSGLAQNCVIEDTSFGESGAGGFRNGDGNEDEDDLDDSDDESLLDFDSDDVVSGYQSQMRERMLQAGRRLDSAKQLGFGVHCEESVVHFRKMMTSTPYVVVHIYDPDDQRCAVLDLLLETLAGAYPATLFRRLSSITAQDFMDSDVQRIGISQNVRYPALGVFVFGSEPIWTTDLGQFVLEGPTHSDSLIKYLENCRVLSVDIEGTLDAALAGHDEIDDNDNYDEIYCDIPGCTKKFAHAHVGSGRQGQGRRSLIDSEGQVI
jgi:hypothetical protein